jgi:hypothetical protein
LLWFCEMGDILVGYNFNEGDNLEEIAVHFSGDYNFIQHMNESMFSDVTETCLKVEIGGKDGFKNAKDLL